MNIDLLIKMTNEIGEFFSGATGEQAARDVATHLKRYWDPRMRVQMLKYYEERHGAGLSDLAKTAVGILYAESKAAPGPAPAGAPPKPAAPAAGAKT
jgi:NADH-dependant formate dehydrogenase delta subunit FdsD